MKKLVLIIFFTLFTVSPLLADSLSQARLADLKNEKNSHEKYLKAYNDTTLSQYSRNYAKTRAIEILDTLFTSNLIDINKYTNLCKQFGHIPTTKEGEDDSQQLVNDEYLKLTEIINSETPEFHRLKSIEIAFKNNPNAFNIYKTEIWNQANNSSNDSFLRSGLLATCLFLGEKISDIASSDKLFNKIEKTHFENIISLNQKSVQSLFQLLLQKNSKENLRKARHMVSSCFSRKNVSAENSQETDEKKTTTPLNNPESKYYAEFVNFANHLYEQLGDKFIQWAQQPIYDVEGYKNHGEDVIFNYLCSHRHQGTQWENDLFDHYNTYCLNIMNKTNYENIQEWSQGLNVLGRGTESKRLPSLVRRFFLARIYDVKNQKYHIKDQKSKKINPHIKIYIMASLLPITLSDEDNELFSLNKEELSVIRNLVKKPDLHVCKALIINALNSIANEDLHYRYEEDFDETYRSIYTDYTQLVEKLFVSKKDKNFRLTWQLKSDGVITIGNQAFYDEIQNVIRQFKRENRKFRYVINPEGVVSTPQWISTVNSLLTHRKRSAGKINATEISITLPVPYEKNKSEFSSTYQHVENVKLMMKSLMTTNFLIGALNKDRKLKENFVNEIQEMMEADNYDIKTEILTSTIEFLTSTEIKDNKTTFRVNITDKSDPYFKLLETQFQYAEEILSEDFWKFYNHITAKEKQNILVKHFDNEQFIYSDHISYIFGNRLFPLEIQLNAAVKSDPNSKNMAKLFDYINNVNENDYSQNSNFKKCDDFLEIFENKQFTTTQKISLLSNTKLRTEFRSACIKGLPAKLNENQHTIIEKVIYDLKQNTSANKVLIKDLLNWVAVNKDYRYYEITESLLDDKDVEIKTATNKAIEEIYKNEKAKRARVEYREKFKKLGKKID